MSAREKGSKAGRGAVESGEKATSLRYKMMDLAKSRKDVISLGTVSYTHLTLPTKA
mgnify:CR=1 FL=1